jgi:HemK-related putative methylase
LYLPEEDSLLLKESINYLSSKNKLNNKLSLDLGCGSCFLTEELLKKGSNVIASDLDFQVFKENKEFIEKLKNNAKEKNKKLFFINSDLLRPFNRVFDFIFFNPPYLIFDEKEKYYLDTTGGLKGYETTERFIEQLINALKINGEAFLILSNYTLNRTINKIKKEGIFQIKILKEKFLLFERIYLAEIEYSNLMKKYKDYFNKNYKEKFKFFSKGKNSIILEKLKSDWLLKLHEKNHREYFYLNYIKNNLKIWKLFIPDFYYKNNILFIKKIEGFDLSILNKEIEKIKGKKFLNYKLKSKLKLKYKILIKSLLITYLLDKIKIDKFEMNHPEKHILFDKKNKRVFFIDFEKAKLSSKPKNTTQLVSFILKEIKKDFYYDNKIENKEINSRMIEKLRKYKKEQNLSNLKAIIDEIKEIIEKELKNLD